MEQSRQAKRQGAACLQPPTNNFRESGKIPKFIIARAAPVVSI